MIKERCSGRNSELAGQARKRSVDQQCLVLTARLGMAFPRIRWAGNHRCYMRRCLVSDRAFESQVRTFAMARKVEVVGQQRLFERIDQNPMLRQPSKKMVVKRRGWSQRMRLEPRGSVTVSHPSR